MDNIFWNLKETLSYNKLLNFIVGARGCGKSYGCKEWCIDDYKKTGKQFIWVRRFNSEFTDFKTTYFNDIKHNYPDDDLSILSNQYSHKFLFNDEIMGYGIPLSISLKKKSIPYNNVDKIIFDEFIIEKGSSHYLKNEVEVFLDLMETVIRLRDDFKCAMFIANAITFTNPYFLYFNIIKPNNKKMIKTLGDILIQFVSNNDFITLKKESRFGKLIEGSNYARFSIENEFLRDNADFIIPTPPNLRYLFTMKSKNILYGIWVNYDKGIMYASAKVDPSCRLIYTTMIEEHKPNTMLLKGGSRSSLFDGFVKNFKCGCVYFDSITTKNVILETIKHTL